jgi:hypothetical protein
MAPKAVLNRSKNAKVNLLIGRAKPPAHLQRFEYSARLALESVCGTHLAVNEPIAAFSLVCVHAAATSHTLKIRPRSKTSPGKAGLFVLQVEG